MATIKGRISTYEMQPGREISVKSDGTAEGQVIYKCDRRSVNSLPRLYSPHPDDPTLVAHDIKIIFNESRLVTAIYSYFGLSAYYDGSNDVIEYDGGCDQVPIQTHPDFENLAGTPESPAEGAIWVDATTGEPTKSNDNAVFKGWSSGELAGVESYLVPRPVLRKTYYRKAAPTIDGVMKIVSRVKGVPNPPGIKNWLGLGGSYRKIGGIYQVTEEYKGSPDGWNKAIYK